MQYLKEPDLTFYKTTSTQRVISESENEVIKGFRNSPFEFVGLENLWVIYDSVYVIGAREMEGIDPNDPPGIWQRVFDSLITN
jgi:hypothetical protein